MKYLLSYITKGPDRASYTIERKGKRKNQSELEENKDKKLKKSRNECKEFLDASYHTSLNATHKMLAYPIHDMRPSVRVLSVHLEGRQMICFDKNNSQLASPHTSLTRWFEFQTAEALNSRSLEARTLRDGRILHPASEVKYIDATDIFTQKTKINKWTWRQRAHYTQIGRIEQLSPKNMKLYCLRRLCHHIRGVSVFKL